MFQPNPEAVEQAVQHEKETHATRERFANDRILSAFLRFAGNVATNRGASHSLPNLKRSRAASSHFYSDILPLETAIGSPQMGAVVQAEVVETRRKRFLSKNYRLVSRQVMSASVMIGPIGEADGSPRRLAEPYEDMRVYAHPLALLLRGDGGSLAFVEPHSDEWAEAATNMQILYKAEMES